MRKMKDSGIEWIGEVPNDWSIHPIRAQFNEVSEKNRLGLVKNALKFTYGNIVRKENFDADDDGYIANTILNYTIVNPGTIMINGLNLNFDFVSQRVALVEERGIITSAYIAFAPILDEQISSRFITYLLKSYDGCKAFHNMGGGVRKILNFSELKKQYIVYPNLSEQHRIADYLDHKCSEIDSLVADIQSQIETLEQYKKSVITEAVTKGLNPDVEMKDSGIEWIGEIPKHWGLVRLKYCFELKGRIGWQGLRSSEFLDDANLPYLITGTDFNNGLVDWSTCAHITFERFHQDVNIQINENDILITKDGTIGKVAVVKDCPPYVSLNSGVFIVRNNREFKINKKYFYYLILSQQFDYWFDISNKGGSTILHLTQEKFYNFKYTYPSLEEQGEIANYLDKKCFVIDDTILMKQDQLSVLEQYKKSLIYEYVTGKKEVPNQ